MRQVIIYAPNVGSGGGLVLLQALLQVWPAEQRMTAILDERAKTALGLKDQNFSVHWAKSSFAGRWHVEHLLSRLAGADDIVFCFHNLPPVLPNRGTVFCYVHNSHLVGLVPTSYLTGWVRTRIAMERFIARRFQRRIDRYMVQTPTMAAALKRRLGNHSPPILILPFLDSEMMPVPLARTAAPSHGRSGAGDGQNATEWDFIYVSDGTVHKNHSTLFDAWQLLAEQGLFPTLALTLHPKRDVMLRERLRVLVEKTGVAIVDLGQLPHAEVLQAYGRARALLFASYAESFGIPLMEAQAAGLPIVAAELDFVRDVCEPAVTFDPFSARSIARAVQRFLFDTHSAITPMTAGSFVAALIEEADRHKS